MNTQQALTLSPLINQIISLAQTCNGKLPDNKAQFFLLLRIADDYPGIWVTRAVASYILGVSKGTLEVWASTGSSDLQYEKTSRLARYRLGEIKRYIKQSTVKSAGKGDQG